MNSKQQFVFWLGVVLILTLLFSTSLDGLVISFFFVSFLLPVVLGTSYCFNGYLVPKFLLTGRRWKFALFLGYLLIVSIYLEMLVMILAFVILADYQIENLGDIVSDIYLMTIILYLVVLANGFVNVVRSLKHNEEKISKLEQDRIRDQTAYLLVRVDRQNIQLKTKEILFVESLSDYIKIHTQNGVEITKEKISSIEKLLPTSFMRLHRSFIVNREHVKSFNREFVTVEGKNLPIGRKYKRQVAEVFGL